MIRRRVSGHETDLRTAAARHFLGLTDTDYLLDVAHAALDRGIDAQGLVEIVIFRDPFFADVVPLFDFALKELGLAPSWEEAINRLAEDYMVKIAEGVNSPLEVICHAHSDYLVMHKPENKSLGPLGKLLEQYYRRDQHYAERYDVDSEFDAQLDQECITLATNWCREHWVPIFDPSWRTTTVVALAQGIRAESAFDHLPILADALQDAGCDHTDILEHCRGPGPHVRGCWVVDLVLGKE